MKKIIVVTVIIIAALWLWFAGYLRSPFVSAPPQSPETQTGFGGSLYDKVVTKNPASALPEMNPFKANTNPFTGVYKNPFGK